MNCFYAIISEENSNGKCLKQYFTLSLNGCILLYHSRKSHIVPMVRFKFKSVNDKLLLGHLLNFKMYTIRIVALLFEIYIVLFTLIWFTEIQLVFAHVSLYGT